MLNPSRRLLAVLCTVLAVFGVASVSASAQPNLQSVNGERTAIMPNAAALQFLAANDISVTPTATATVGSSGALILPITHGVVNVSRVHGHIYHSGGVTFSHAGRSLNYRDFILVRDGGRTFLSALVNDRGREIYAWVDSFAVTPSGNEATVTGELKLSKSTAHSFNWLVGSNVASAGTEISWLTSTIRFGG